jgi:replicative DNA helicase
LILLGVLQENLITLLAFDDVNALIIRNAIELSHYGGPYRVISERCYDYIDKYRKAPQGHLPDILDDKLRSANKREASLYEDVLVALHEANETVNVAYVMAQLETFTRRQSLRSIAIDLTKALQRDTDQSLEEADNLIHAARTQSMKLFDPGLRLSDVDRVLDFLDIHTEAFPTGIAELDKRGFGPTRKELWLFIANTKGGKTWALMHLCKVAAMHRLRVCHITLELSEARAAQRYVQSFFAVSKRRENFMATRFEKDNLGRITGIDNCPIHASMSLADGNIRAKLIKRMTKSRRAMDNIVVKEFPTGALTVHQLKAYLDNLEATERFAPDLLIIDYPDLMRLDRDNYRMSLDELYKDIRGIAVERNIAVAVVSQSHRAAAKAKLVGAENVAEAYSKIAHADTVISMSQTTAERRYGLARLHVAAGRNDADRITIVISQSYATGQFLVESQLMKGNYWDILGSKGGDDETVDS